MLLTYAQMFFGTSKKKYRQSGNTASSKFDGMRVVCKITITQRKTA